MDAYTMNPAQAPAAFNNVGMAPQAALYRLDREANRTLRMDTGGVCQYCARKSERRVELNSPLWQAGPLMYGECCLPLAEAVLRDALPLKVALTVSRPEAHKPRQLWVTAAVTTAVGFLAIGVERLLQVALF